MQVSETAVLSAENSILRQENDTLRRSLAEHIALLSAVQAQRQEEDTTDGASVPG